MQNKPVNERKNASRASRLLARVLPFDRVWLRYACCFWLALCVGAALWAALVIQPATDTLLARSSYLIELEEDLHRAQSSAAMVDLPTLRQRAASTEAGLYRDASSLNLAIVDIVDHLKSQGWKAIVAGVERNSERSEHLVYAAYRLELNKNADRDSGAQPVSAEILSFLQTVATREQRIAIDHLEILSEGEHAAKVFATLSAAISK